MSSLSFETRKTAPLKRGDSFSLDMELDENPMVAYEDVITDERGNTLNQRTGAIDIPSPKKTPKRKRLINALLKPRKVEIATASARKQAYRMVSMEDVTREQVNTLRKRLNKELKLRKTRPVGLDYIKEALIKSTFEEIIRQVAINCEERGTLLKAVMDERMQTTHSWVELTQKAAAFRGSSKAEAFDEEKCRENIEKLKRRKTSLTAKIRVQQRSLDDQGMRWKRIILEKKKELEKNRNQMKLQVKMLESELAERHL